MKLNYSWFVFCVDLGFRVFASQSFVCFRWGRRNWTWRKPSSWPYVLCSLPVPSRCLFLLTISSSLQWFVLRCVCDFLFNSVLLSLCISSSRIRNLTDFLVWWFEHIRNSAKHFRILQLLSKNTFIGFLSRCIWIYIYHFTMDLHILFIFSAISMCNDLYVLFNWRFFSFISLFRI